MDFVAEEHKLIVVVHGCETQYDRGPYRYLVRYCVLFGEFWDYIYWPEAYALWTESAVHAA